MDGVAAVAASGSRPAPEGRPLAAARRQPGHIWQVLLANPFGSGDGAAGR